jgi:hypothetical protein
LSAAAIIFPDVVSPEIALNTVAAGD